MKVKDKKREKEQTTECQEKVKTLMEQGYDIVFLDETMVTRSTLPKLEWSLPGANVSYDTRDLYVQTTALLAGISMKKGVDFWMTFPRSVNIEKFKQYLKGLRKARKDEKIAVFMDQLAVHRSAEVRALLDNMGIPYVYNVSYSPDYQPIELVFA